jgi:hypothetical protein
MPYTAIMIGSSTSVAVNATVSVETDATGISIRGKPMLSRIDPRSCTEVSALTTLAIRSVNGTTAHAMLSPIASSVRDSTSETSSR